MIKRIIGGFRYILTGKLPREVQEIVKYYSIQRNDGYSFTMDASYFGMKLELSHFLEDIYLPDDIRHESDLDLDCSGYRDLALQARKTRIRYHKADNTK